MNTVNISCLSGPSHLQIHSFNIGIGIYHCTTVKKVHFLDIHTFSDFRFNSKTEGMSRIEFYVIHELFVTTKLPNDSHSRPATPALVTVKEHSIVLPCKL